MFEVAGLFVIVLLIAASAFFSLGYSIVFDSTKKGPQAVIAEAEISAVKEQKIPEDSLLKRHCLTSLPAEIESAFAPRPTDSVLQRHHDALIAFELEKRLQDLQLTA